jgi:replicative DNA helicase
MGKSVLAVDIANEVAINQGKTVLFFSLEMDAKEITQRVMHCRAMQHNTDMKAGWISHTDWVRIGEAQADFRKSNLIIDETPAIDIQRVEARCRQEAARTGQLDLVIIDYLGLMGTTSAKFENRQTEVAALSKRLKELSRSLNVPVLALSQLSRKLDDRAEKRPMPSDLRESGSLEQDADCIIFIYRDEVYNPDSEDAGFAEIIVAKNRQGSTGVVELAWVPELSMFANVTTAA